MVLLAEQTPDHISVNQICAAADIHRATFYRYFSNTTAFLDYGFTVLAQEAMMGVSQARADLLSTQNIVAFLSEHRHAMRHLVLSKHYYRLQQVLSEPIEQHLLAVFTAAGKCYTSPVNPKIMARFYVGGMTRVLFMWLQQPYCTEQTLVAELDTLARHMMRDCMNR